MPKHEDVIIATLGASAALAGLVLVFLGIIVTTLQGFEGDTPQTVLTPFQRAGAVTLIAFVLGAACVTVSALWLLTECNESLYLAALTTFFSQLGLLVIAAVLVARRVLWP